jgi:predicted AAA+ superfamily ATPase
MRNFQDFEPPRLVEREPRVEPDLPARRTISIIGPRRAGKAFLMFQTIRGLLEGNVDKSRMLYVNLESDLLIRARCAEAIRFTQLW